MALAALLLGLALAWLLSRVLPLALIDFQHYDQASHLIWQGQDPYGVIEFFAPPWLAIFLAPLLPLPIKLASAVWVMVCLASIGASAMISQQWLAAPRRPWARLGSLVFMLLTPAALFVYITGQLSGIVGLAALVAGGEFIRPDCAPRRWVLAVALAVTTVKPNIIWLPAALITLQVVRQRDWRAIVACVVVLGALAALSFARLPVWPASLLAAWQGGAYRGGVGLAAAGYIGLPELGVPAWLFGPLLAYLFWQWWREGLSVRVLALAFAVGLLVTPYSRSYDQVVLILPSMACLAIGGGFKRWLCPALLLLAWIAPLLTLAVLAPVFASMAALLAFAALRPAREPLTNVAQNG
jgi:hypothetical protein